MTLTRIGVFGSSGRMGRAVTEILEADYADRARLTATVSTRLGELADLADVDVVIDFSLPAGTDALVEWLHRRQQRLPALVCGTTGLGHELCRRLEQLGERTAVIYSPNYSTGVAALTSILKRASPLLAALGYTPVLSEVHHQHKLDAPSGTAKSLLRVIRPEAPDSVQVHSIRAGEVIGKHEVTFFGREDQIVIGHDANDRRLFARGAVEAALWVCDQPAATGYHSMRDYFRRRYLD